LIDALALARLRRRQAAGGNDRGAHEPCYDARMKSDPSPLVRIARRYVWWSAPERTIAENLPRLIAQVMEMGTWKDAHELLALLGGDAFENVLRHPPPSVLSPKSWVFWHHRLGLGEAPELATKRNIPNEVQSGASAR
jgi:hypothetical protein